MTLRPTPMVCRLLFVCFLCTLWGGQVMATPKEKVQSVAEFVKNAQEATQKILADLTNAEECANKQEEIEKENVDGANLTPYYEKTKRNGEELSAAVTNAAREAEEVLTAVQAVEPSTEEELKKLVTDATEQTDILVKALRHANANAQVIHATVQNFDLSKHDYEPIQTQMKNILPVLKEATSAANSAHQFFQEAMKTAAGTGEASQKTSKDEINLPAETLQGTAGNGSEKRETKHTDRPQDTVRPHGSNMNSPPGRRDNEQSTPTLPTTTGPSEGDTPPPALQEGNDADTAHGGAIATCTAVPLLLLLTAVAYAAVC